MKKNLIKIYCYTAFNSILTTKKKKSYSGMEKLTHKEKKSYFWEKCLPNS